MGKIIRADNHFAMMTGPVNRSRGIETPTLRDLLISLFDRLGEWQDRAATRRRLMAFDDRMLRDIGLDRGLVAAESEKPFWRA